MQTVQVVMEEDLLRSADRAARRFKLNRSALIRNALREHLERLDYRGLERREREAYERIPDAWPGEWRARFACSGSRSRTNSVQSWC